MFKRKSLVFLILLTLWVFTSICIASDLSVGVVLLHGKGGFPSHSSLTGLAGKLRDNGFIVTAPEMPYSKSRQYDKRYQDTALEIDNEVADLKKNGAKKIFIAGHSLGANVALYYATRTSVDGVIAIAPGHSPEAKKMRAKLEADVERARKMIKEGQGNNESRFDDTNQGRMSSVTTTANIYLSWFDPDGQAVMPKNAAALKPGTALLWVIGTRDPLYHADTAYAFDKAPQNPKNKYVVVDSDHMGTPAEAAREIVSWLNTFK
jgi:esterase/lipase